MEDTLPIMNAIETWIPMAISIVALAASIFSVGWTIHMDVRRPKFRVSIAKKILIGQGSLPSDPFLLVEALNVGPIPNRVGLVFARAGWWKRRVVKAQDSNAVIMHDPNHPANSPQSVLNDRIEVGDRATFVMPYNADSFLKEGFIQIGVADGYGKIHWAPTEQVKELKKSFQNDFPTDRASNES